MSGRTNRSRHSRSPSNDWVKRSLLAKVDKSTLKDIRVTICRNELLGKADDESKDKPINMEMDDPEAISRLVHKRRGAYTPGKIFGKNIKVNQDFPDDRKVTSHEERPRRKSRSRSRSRSRKYRSRSREKRRKSRSPSRSRERRRRSSTGRSRSRSRHRKDKSRRRSRSRSRYSRRYSRSRSRSLESHEHKPECPMYKDSDRNRRKRSITPLRPGEYRPGHPDLALRERRVFHRSPSPERSKHMSMQMPMDYGYYEGYPPMMMPFRPRFPMMVPPFYPRMYTPMQPRFRPRWPIVYNTGAVKNGDKKPATVTSGEVEKKDDEEGVSSSDKS